MVDTWHCSPLHCAFPISCIADKARFEHLDSLSSHWKALEVWNTVMVYRMWWKEIVNNVLYKSLSALHLLFPLRSVLLSSPLSTWASMQAFQLTKTTSKAICGTECGSEWHTWFIWLNLLCSIEHGMNDDYITLHWFPRIYSDLEVTLVVSDVLKQIILCRCCNLR